MLTMNKDYHFTVSEVTPMAVDIKYSSDTVAFVLYSVDCYSLRCR